MVLSLEQNLSVDLVFKFCQLLWAYEHLAIEGGSDLYLRDALNHFPVQVLVPANDGVHNSIHALLFDSFPFVPESATRWLSFDALVVHILHHVHDLFKVRDFFGWPWVLRRNSGNWPRASTFKSDLVWMTLGTFVEAILSCESL